MSEHKHNLAPETGHVHRVAGPLLVVVFLLVIATPAVLQVAFETGGWFDTPATETKPAARDRHVQALDLFLKLNDLSVFTPAEPGEIEGRPWTMLDHLERFEDDLEERSVLATASQPWVQWLQLKLLRQGNDKVMVGRDGWLFYRPGVGFITTKPFGDANVAARPNDAKAPAADPLPIILAFHEQLKERGIDLVLAPVPVKATIYPERLVPGYDAAQGPPVNVATERFFEQLREQGVTVIDLTDELWAERDSQQLFLPLDTHWTPAGMSVFAKGLAKELRARFEYLQDPTHMFEVRPKAVTNRGDIFNMLRLPAGQDMFPPTTVNIEQVFDAGTGRPVTTDVNSRVVLLGDSATNIYSIDQEMGWGQHAGLAEHLSLHMERPVHWIAVNGGGPALTRQRLARDGIDRRNVVVWQFLMRDLTHPENPWEHVPMPREAAVDWPEGPVRVRARIKKITQPPRPDAFELYPSTVIYTLYEVIEVVEGEYPLKELVAVEWAQRNMEFFDAFNYRVGDEHDLHLIPLAQAEEQDPALRQSQFVDDARRYDLRPYWVQRHEQ